MRRRVKNIKKSTVAWYTAICILAGGIGGWAYSSFKRYGKLNPNQDYETKITDLENYFDYELDADKLKHVFAILTKDTEKIVLATKYEECNYYGDLKPFKFKMNYNPHLHYKSIIDQQVYESTCVINSATEVNYINECSENTNESVKEITYVNDNSFNKVSNIAEYMTSEELDKVLTNTMTTEDWQVVEDRLNTQWSSSKKLIKRTDLY